MLAYISAGLNKKQSYGGRLDFGNIVSCQSLKYVNFYLSQFSHEDLPLALGGKKWSSQCSFKFYNFDDKSGEEKSLNS